VPQFPEPTLKGCDVAIESPPSAPVPGFETVNCKGELFAPTAKAPNASWFGVTANCAVGNPFPVRPTKTGVNPAAVDWIVTEPMRVPGTVGENVTVNEHIAPLPNCVLQPFCCRLKSPAIENCKPASTVAPELLTVTVCAGLVRPTVTAPKLTTAGFTIIEPAGIPFPVNGTTAGATPTEVLLIVNKPARIPIVEGVKFTPVVHVSPAARVAAQEFPTMLKSPVVEIANPLTAAPPGFETVSVCVVEVSVATTLPNVICVGLVSIPPTAVPFPSSGITSGTTDRLLTETVSAPG
jgi:hypothetical protein